MAKKILVFTEGTILKPTSDPHDYASYIPTTSSVEKLTTWKNQGASIHYMTSRRTKEEVQIVQTLLKKFKFPDFQNLFFRQQGEEYKDVAEKVLPDILIEDDCASIGGQKEMVYPHLRPALQKNIHSVVVPEFEGIDTLSDDIMQL